MSESERVDVSFQRVFGELIERAAHIDTMLKLCPPEVVMQKPAVYKSGLIIVERMLGRVRGRFGAQAKRKGKEA